MKSDAIYEEVLNLRQGEKACLPGGVTVTRLLGGFAVYGGNPVKDRRGPVGTVSGGEAAAVALRRA